MIEHDRIFSHLKCEVVEELRDKELGMDAIFALDRSIDGQCVAGLRFVPNLTLEEVQDLARAMTLKQGFLGFPRGGARVGVRSSADIDDEIKQAMINRIGEWLLPYVQNRNTLLGQDVGTSARHFEAMYRHLGIPLPKHSDSSRYSGLYTSLSVLECLAEAAAWAGIELKGARVAVEGFGRVGTPLAQGLAQRGARVVSISTVDGALYNDKGLAIDRIAARASESSDWLDACKDEGDRLNSEELPSLPVDILAPCGTDSTIHAGNADRLQARLICSGANNPVTQGARQRCFERGIQVLPDYITNAGGVLGNSVTYLGLDRTYIIRILREHLIPVLKTMVDQAREQQIPVCDLAEQMIQSKLDRRSGPTGKKSHLKTCALQLYRKGLIPRALTRGYGYRSIVNMIESGWVDP